MMFPALALFGNLAFFLLRFALGVIFLYHAYPKLKNTKNMASMMGWQPSMVWLLGAVELLGGLSVLLGVYAQAGALALGVVMLGALYYKLFVWHTPFSAHDKMGWEFDLILLAATLPIITTGGGAWILI